MSGVVWSRSPLRCCVLSFLLIFGLISQVAGQDFSPTPYAQSSMGTGSGLDLAPSNPLSIPGSTAGLPRGSDSVYLSSGMFRDFLPPIPNLEVGYLYNFGNNVRTGRLTLDYVLPVGLGQDSTVFGEAHGDFTNFWKTIQRLFRSGNTTTSLGSFNERIDLSIGGGYRRLFNDSLLLGANGFYDSSKLGDRWYGSGGFGLEMASLLPGNDMLDLNFNYYGNLFQGRNSIVNAFRNGTGNFDIEAGYSHQLYERGPDLRLKVTGYQFDIGTKVYGWNTGAHIATRDGMFRLTYEVASDRINGTYHTVGGFVNVGLQLENLLSGSSPFTAPKPLFRSPRNLRRWLSKKVERNWHQAAVIVSQRQEDLSLFATRTIADRNTTWPQGPPNPFPDIQIDFLLPGPMSRAEVQSAKRIVITFTVSGNTTDRPVRVGLGHSVTATRFLAGSTWFPAGPAANGTHTSELTPGQFTQDVDMFVAEAATPPNPAGGFCFSNVVVRFYR